MTCRSRGLAPVADVSLWCSSQDSLSRQDAPRAEVSFSGREDEEEGGAGTIPVHVK